MIVGNLKPIEEIVESIKDYKKILILGCGTCVTVCLSGGEREARELWKVLKQASLYKGMSPEFQVETIQRQCEIDLVKEYLHVSEEIEAVLSLGCGAGVQTVADALEPLPVIPALNTTFLGALDQPGIWEEKCKGCGDCVLSLTGGICPVTRCAKSLFNGPCGGSQDGRCEVDPETPCAWALIYYRLKKQGKLHLMEAIVPPKDWQPSTHGGPRKRIRKGIGGGAYSFWEESLY